MLFEQHQDSFPVDLVFDSAVIRVIRDISPYISHIHQSDPTIDSICFNKNNCKYLTRITAESITLLELISRGESIEVDQTQILQLEILSILLKNEELFRKLDSLFPHENDENKINEELEFVSFLETNTES